MACDKANPEIVAHLRDIRERRADLVRIKKIELDRVSNLVSRSVQQQDLEDAQVAYDQAVIDLDEAENELLRETNKG